MSYGKPILAPAWSIADGATCLGDLVLGLGNKLLLDSAGGNDYIWTDTDGEVKVVVAGTNALRMTASGNVFRVTLQPLVTNSPDIGTPSKMWRTGYFGTSVVLPQGGMLDLGGDAVVGVSGEHFVSDPAGYISVWAGGTKPARFGVDGLLVSAGTLFLQERAAALASVGARGQVWVKTATPNELWFTDDAGTDHQLAYV